MSLVAKTRQGFEEAFGEAPDGVVFVPGRVNLIGEHVDYNDGLVLPMPISTGTAVAWGRQSAPAIEAVALDFGNERDCFVSGDDARQRDSDGWRSYLRGTCDGLRARGEPLTGARLAIAGSIARGSGLSSSASLCVAIGRALAAAAGAGPIDPRSLALAAQHAEHHWAGVHCGIMDQMAVAAGEAGSALLLDCENLDTRSMPLPDQWAVMIVQSGVRRGLVDGHYNQRRLDCEAAAKAIGVASLRHATLDQLRGANLSPPVEQRARHVISEIARVRQAVTAIAAQDIASLGELLRESHRSLRDDFEVSEPNVDRLVDVLNAAIGSAGGARMTGGGFGGAVVAVLPESEIARVRASVLDGYSPPGGGTLEVMIEPSRHAMALGSD